MAATILTPLSPRLSFDPELIRKYDGLGPRYTSYPTADRFTEAFTAEHLANALLGRGEGLDRRRWDNRAR